MKKAAVCFSLTVLFIFFGYVSLKMSDSLKQSPSYEGTKQEIINKAAEVTGSIDTASVSISDFRSFDFLCEAAILLSAATGVSVVLRKHNKSKGGS